MPDTIAPALALCVYVCVCACACVRLQACVFSAKQCSDMHTADVPYLRSGEHVFVLMDKCARIYMSNGCDPVILAPVCECVRVCMCCV